MKFIIHIIRLLRRKYWELKLQECGKNFTCCSGVVIRKANKMIVGDDVRIGEDSFINALGGLKIGNNVHMGPRVFIWTASHNYYAPKSLPYDSQKIPKNLTTIEDNVWLGANSSIIPGVTIGEGAVVAMCSVVTKDVPPCAVVGGNPAKILKYRDVEHYKKLKSQQHYDK